MRRNSFKSTFFIKKNQLLKNGEAPVMLRITANSLRVQVHTRHSINPDLWNQAKECSRARDARSRELNDYLESSKARLRDIFLHLEQDGKPVTAEIVKNKFFGLDENDRKTLVGFFKEHNEQSRKLIGIDYVDITVRRYECCARYLEEYIREKYGEDDLLLREINGEFVRGFEFFMKTVKRCQQNTVIRYMKCFKSDNLVCSDKTKSLIQLFFHKTFKHFLFRQPDKVLRNK